MMCSLNIRFPLWLIVHQKTVIIYIVLNWQSVKNGLTVTGFVVPPMVRLQMLRFALIRSQQTSHQSHILSNRMPVFGVSCHVRRLPFLVTEELVWQATVSQLTAAGWSLLLWLQKRGGGGGGVINWWRTPPRLFLNTPAAFTIVSTLPLRCPVATSSLQPHATCYMPHPMPFGSRNIWL